MNLSSLDPLPQRFHRLELSYFMPRFRKVLMDMWCDVYCVDDMMINLGGPRDFDCINDYGKDLIPILGYIDSSAEEFKRNLALTQRMINSEQGLGHQGFSIVVGMTFSHATTVLPLVFATQVYRLWYKLFEDAAGYYYKFERRRDTRDRSPKDSRGAS
jgi:hypothetical protein